MKSSAANAVGCWFKPQLSDTKDILKIIFVAFLLGALAKTNSMGQGCIRKIRTWDALGPVVGEVLSSEEVQGAATSGGFAPDPQFLITN